MEPLQTVLAKAARSNRTIALSEGADPRIIEAAVQARTQNMAQLILVGNEADIRSGLAQAGGSDGPGLVIFDPMTSELAPVLAAKYHDLRQHKGVTADIALAEAQKPHIAAALLVKLGYADGTLGGAVTTTADIVRAALQVIGKAPDARIVSSFFLMLLCEEHHTKKGAYVFSDAGLVVDPSATEMAEIAVTSAASFTALLDQDPRIAMLSFSTHGSAKHPMVSKVSEATALARTLNPNLMIDGELQFDAAFVPDVARAKAPNSSLDGAANVFIFPNLDAGNIGYKIAQRIGGARAIGPILQGLAQPANDLSRGCTAQDVLHMIAVTAAQCDTKAKPAQSLH